MQLNDPRIARVVESELDQIRVAAPPPGFTLHEMEQMRRKMRRALLAPEPPKPLRTLPATIPEPPKLMSLEDYRHMIRQGAGG